MPGPDLDNGYCLVDQIDKILPSLDLHIISEVMILFWETSNMKISIFIFINAILISVIYIVYLISC